MVKPEYLRMTSASDVFSYNWDKHRGKLELRWDMGLDLRHIAMVRLSAIQLTGLYVDDYILVPLYCNLIDSTTLNPLREVDRVLVEPESPIVNQSSTGEQILTEPIQTNSEIHTCSIETIDSIIFTLQHKDLNVQREFLNSPEVSITIVLENA